MTIPQKRRPAGRRRSRCAALKRLLKPIKINPSWKFERIFSETAIKKIVADCGLPPTTTGFLKEKLLFITDSVLEQQEWQSGNRSFGRYIKDFNGKKYLWTPPKESQPTFMPPKYDAGGGDPVFYYMVDSLCDLWVNVLGQNIVAPPYKKNGLATFVSRYCNLVGVSNARRLTVAAISKAVERVCQPRHHWTIQKKRGRRIDTGRNTNVKSTSYGKSDK